jgi:hypothetical protein
VGDETDNTDNINEVGATELVKAMAAVLEGAGGEVVEYDTAVGDYANEPGTLPPIVERTGADPIDGNECAVLALLQVAGASDNLVSATSAATTGSAEVLEIVDQATGNELAVLNLLELAGTADKQASLTAPSIESAKVLETPEATATNESTDKQTLPKSPPTTESA